MNRQLSQMKLIYSQSFLRLGFIAETNVMALMAKFSKEMSVEVMLLTVHNEWVYTACKTWEKCVVLDFGVIQSFEMQKLLEFFLQNNFIWVCLHYEELMNPTKRLKYLLRKRQRLARPFDFFQNARFLASSIIHGQRKLPPFRKVQWNYYFDEARLSENLGCRVKRLKKTPKYTTCNLCYELKENLFLDCCKKFTMCRLCLYKWFRDKDTCPHCRKVYPLVFEREDLDILKLVQKRAGRVIMLGCLKENDRTYEISPANLSKFEAGQIPYLLIKSHVTGLALKGVTDIIVSENYEKVLYDLLNFILPENFLTVHFLIRQ